MDESITRAAGGVNGREMDAATLQAAIRSIGREPRQRTTTYGVVDARVVADAAPPGLVRAAG
jgi:FO synthase